MDQGGHRITSRNFLPSRTRHQKVTRVKPPVSKLLKAGGGIAASADVRRGYCLKPTNWLKRGCWADEHLERAGRHVSDSADAVWSAIDTMPARDNEPRAYRDRTNAHDEPGRSAGAQNCGEAPGDRSRSYG